MVGSAEAGAAKAAVCAACHGATGNSINPEWPNLAGQGHWYIAEQLMYFKGQVRANAVMGAQAIALEPANPAYETRIFGADRVSVQGRLVGLIRQY